MIKANRDPNVLIKEIDKAFIHVRLRKTNFDPKNPKNQTTREIIQCFLPKEFEQMEANRTGKHPVDWVTVGGFDEAYVVHDGRLLSKEPEVQKSDVEVAVQSAVKEAVKKETRKANVRKNMAQNTAK